MYFHSLAILNSQQIIYNPKSVYNFVQHVYSHIPILNSHSSNLAYRAGRQYKLLKSSTPCQKRIQVGVWKVNGVWRTDASIGNGVNSPKKTCSVLQGLKYTLCSSRLCLCLCRMRV